MTLHVDVHPADEGGCGHSRLIFPARALADDPNVDVTIGGTLRVVGAESTMLGRVPLNIDTDADVVVLQRPLRSELVTHIPLLQRQGVAVVVEVDDDFNALPKGHPARKRLAPANSPHSNWRHLAEACRLADLVTVSTPALAERYGAHGRVRVLRNCVPAAYLDVMGATNEKPTIGWPGLVATHIGDLEIVGDAVADVVADGARFRAIGSAATLEGLGVAGEVIPWAALTDLGRDGYAATIGGLDIGIVPLADNPFNRAKSALKGLEMAALGVPFVASPLPEYQALHKVVGGLLVSTVDEWREALRRLVESPELRREMSERGREAMRSWTYEVRCSEWADAWMTAASTRRERGCAA